MANKNIEMLKSFFKIIIGNQEEIDLIIPDMYVKDIYNIDYQYLKKKGYNNLVFDIDNTILPVNDIQVTEQLNTLFTRLEKQKFNICIVSNNNKDRVLPVAEKLNTSCLFMAGKPHKRAFDKALMVLNSKLDDTVLIGDQMLSDIKGAKEYGLYSILVEPISNIYDIKTGTARVLQNIMLKKLEKTNKFKRRGYYKERK